MAKLRAELLEGGLLAPQGIDAGLGLEHLGGELLDGLAVLLHLAVRGDQLLRGLLRFRRRGEERLDPRIDLGERPEALFEAGDPRVHVRDLARRHRRLLVHLLERLADLRQPAAAQRDLREHGVEGTSLFFRRDNQGLEFFGLFLCLATAQTLEHIEHDRPSLTLYL